MMTIKPTILFVHGSWHTPAHFERARVSFREAGYESVCPRQPSVGKGPPIGLMEDARCITDELARLVESEDKEVVVVAHSYGGIVATQSVEERFSKASRKESGKKGGVLLIVYVTAFFVSLGSSLSTPFGGALAPYIDVDEHGMCIMSDPEHKFYNDLPVSEQLHWTGEMLRSPASTQLEPITKAAYLYHPISYIYCTLDEALPLSIQQNMVATVSEKYSLSILTESLRASHSPYLSMPDKLVVIVDKQLNAVYTS